MAGPVPTQPRAALARRRTRRSEASGVGHGPVPARGDVRVVVAGRDGQGEPRLALVLRVEEVEGFSEILLVHTATELACDPDVVIERQRYCGPYDIVCESDLRSLVRTDQLASAVERLDDTLMVGLNETLCAGPEASPYPGLRLGLPLFGPDDPRWSFKASEGDALRRLAAEATAAALAGPDMA